MELADAKKSRQKKKVVLLQCHICGETVERNGAFSSVRCFDCRKQYIKDNAHKYAK